MGEERGMRADARTRTSPVAAVVLTVVTAMLVAVCWAMLASGANAAPNREPYSEESPTVLPTRLDRDRPKPPPEDEILPERTERRPAGAFLPNTGADLALFAVTGVAAVGTGAAVVRRTRRRED